jgi:hypothetical protein
MVAGGDSDLVGLQCYWRGKNRGLRQETGILALITLLADCGPEAGLLGKQIEAAGDKLEIRPGGPGSMGSRRILEGSQGTHWKTGTQAGRQGSRRKPGF